MSDTQQSLADGTQFSSQKALWWSLAAAAALVGLIFLLGPPISEAWTNKAYGAHFVYRWQLDDPTWITRTVAWTCYTAHQLSMWWLIYYAQSKKLRYSNKLHRVNVAALLLNLGFILLHIAQSHTFYDGIAQDVHEGTALGSVTLMLVLILLMENNHRGMFFGTRMPISKRVTDWVRRYHGYYFSWAIVYTFWYHPTEITIGHLAGFAYMFLLLIQSSLFFTRMHVNRWWKFTLEAIVVVHGTTVAWAVDMDTGNTSRYRFFFGFLGLVIITQMHGLKISKTVRGLFTVAYVLGVVTALHDATSWVDLTGPLRIPLGEYILVVIFSLLIWLGLFIADSLGKKPEAEQAAEGKTSDALS